MNENFYFENKNGVLLLKSRVLSGLGIKHCFTTRKGGVSTGYLAETNLAFSREDYSAVSENYRRVALASGFSGNAFVLSNQTHSDTVRNIDSEYNVTGFYTMSNQTDGLVTGKTDVCLCVFTADCVPILIADRHKKAVAAVHSGWRGTAAKIAQNAVDIMEREYGCRRDELCAVIGPCIGACCYEVGADVFDGFSDSTVFTDRGNGKYMLDLNKANIKILEESGVGTVHCAFECTACNSDIYYSHRVTKGKRGNMAAMIEL